MKRSLLLVCFFLLLQVSVLASANNSRDEVEKQADQYYENIKSNNKEIMKDIFNNANVDIDLYEDTSGFNFFDKLGTRISRAGYKLYVIVKKTYAYLATFFLIIGWTMYFTFTKARGLGKLGFLIGTIIPLVLTIIYFNPILRAL